MNDNQKNKIFIIGNGFDLNCGLHSRFSDFCDYSFSYNFGTNCPDFLGYVYGQRENNFANFFILLLSFLKSGENEIARIFSRNLKNNELVNWCDFEQILANLVSYKNLYNYFYKIYEQIMDCRNIERNMFQKLFYNYKVKNKDCDFLHYLIKQLKDFEIQFSDFLNKDISFNKDYNKNKDKLKKYLAIDKNSYVINFNYTNIKNEGDTFIENHIHGSLNERNVIIGIDGLNECSDKNSNQEVFTLFTKSLRRMNNQQNIIEDLNMPKDISNIVFYGHSLNKQDYSYFQSIFDLYNIYDSDVKLTFYYSDDYVADTEKNQLRLDVILNINNLLNIYGQTFTNKDHGKNLMYKLLLENRLIIKKL